MKLGCLHEVCHLIQAFSRLLVLHGVVNQKPLPHGGAEGVHHPDGAVGVLGRQFLGSQDGSGIGGAEAGGEGQNQKVLPSSQNGGHEGAPALGVYGGGAGGCAGAQRFVKCLHLQAASGVAVQKILVFRPLKLDTKGGVGDPQGSRQGGGQIAGRVGEDLIVCGHRETLRFIDRGKSRPAAGLSGLLPGLWYNSRKAAMILSSPYVPPSENGRLGMEPYGNCPRR